MDDADFACQDASDFGGDVATVSGGKHVGAHGWRPPDPNAVFQFGHESSTPSPSLGWYGRSGGSDFTGTMRPHRRSGALFSSPFRQDVSFPKILKGRDAMTLLFSEFATECAEELLKVDSQLNAAFSLEPVRHNNTQFCHFFRCTSCGKLVALNKWMGPSGLTVAEWRERFQKGVSEPFQKWRIFAFWGNLNKHLQGCTSKGLQMVEQLQQNPKEEHVERRNQQPARIVKALSVGGGMGRGPAAF